MGKLPKKKILVIDDEPQTRKFLRISLGAHDHTVIEAASGREAVALAIQEAPDLIILDLGLPDIQGHELLRTIRARNEGVPIVVLSSRGDEAGKVQALDLGADDYLTKPFGVQELGARIQALLRRSQSAAVATSSESTTYRDANLEVDWAAREVRVDGEVVGLTKLEFQLLQTFVRHPGQALATQQLLEQVWNDPFGIGPERVKFTVLRLRRKLGWQEDQKDVLEAIRGYGYRYTPMGDTMTA